MADLSSLRDAARTTSSVVRAALSAVFSGVRATARLIRRQWQRLAGNVWGRRLGIGTAIVTISLTGSVLGILLGARTDAEVGPFHAELSLTPSLTGDTNVVIPPLGALSLDDHDGPAHLAIRLGALDQTKAEAVLTSPNGITAASQDATDDLSRGVIRLGLRTLAVAVAGSLVLALLVFRNIRRVAWAGGLSLLVTAGSLGAAAATFRADSIEEPRYEGLLVNAPAVVGDARQIATRYQQYSEQLQQIVANVTKFYSTLSTLQVYEPDPNSIRVLHISDMHLNPGAWSVVNSVIQEFKINLVIDTGDIVDWGSQPETSYVNAISSLRVPYVFIRGNHDSAKTAAAVARNRNAIVLENSVREVAGLTIAGIGDPRFTPDKESAPPGSNETHEFHEAVTDSGETLATTIRGYGKPVDIALVHDPASAGPLATTCPLVLAGHLHKREMATLPRPADAAPDAPNTTLMVEGSTGGAGLRGLEHEEPLSLEMSVLYFDNADEALQAYDNITVGGTGLSQVALERHIYKPPALDGAITDGSPSPSPS